MPIVFFFFYITMDYFVFFWLLLLLSFLPKTISRPHGGGMESEPLDIYKVLLPLRSLSVAPRPLHICRFFFGESLDEESTRACLFHFSHPIIQSHSLVPSM